MINLEDHVDEVEKDVKKKLDIVISKITTLEERIKALEEQKDPLPWKSPLIPTPSIPWGPTPLTPIDPWKPTLSCKKCGLDLSVSMGYCCQNADCPCGLGPTTC